MSNKFIFINIMKVTEKRIKEMRIIPWDKILNWIAGIENRANYIKKSEILIQLIFFFQQALNTVLGMRTFLVLIVMVWMEKKEDQWSHHGNELR